MARILSSRKLNPSQAELLLNAGISYVDYRAIQIDFLAFEAPETIDYAIITSQNTVKALLNKNVAIKACFCVGQKTKALLEKHDFTVVEYAEYGRDLAQKIIDKHRDKSFYFFCGNKRRPEIPTHLRENAVSFEEIFVYQTQLNPKSFNQEFDGIMFFSPSQVKSFAVKNEFKTQQAFCIGTTTAAEARKHTDSVITASTPTVENVIVKVIKTYKK